MGPSPEEAKLIGDWLDAKSFKCPGCGSAEHFALGGTVALPNISASIVDGQKHMSTLVMLKCKACAFVSMLAPDVMRIPQT